MNDKKPELNEKFELRLVSAKSNDGKDESTERSGASISPVSSVANITIEENDSPYGLLQFSSEAPKNGSTISPLSGLFTVEVQEGIGKFKLYVERAQGLLSEWGELFVVYTVYQHGPSQNFHRGNLEY